MALYKLDYDLRSPTRNYQPLYDELKRFNATRILESSWAFVRYNTSAAALRDHFKRFIDANDGLIVCEVTDWATYNTLSTPKAVTA